MARLMPTREEAAELVPGRGSVTWHLAGDARLMLASGYALLLGSATRLSGRACKSTPTTRAIPGAGCALLDFTNVMVYGGPDAAWRWDGAFAGC